MIPPEVERRMKSRAEEKIFNRLRAVRVSGLEVALHSVNLAEHEFKTVGEIDFVLLGPAGLFALEVKGGRVSCADGVWTFTDRYDNRRRKKESPFEQARTAVYSLRDRLSELAGSDLVGRMAFGWGAVFPDQLFEQQSVEWADEMVLASDGLAQNDGFGRWLRGLVRYWTAKERHSKPLSPADVGAVLNALRPDFDVVPTLRHRTEEAERDVAALTALQYRLLDALDDNARLLCQGGAGTGKTLLAAEAARREAAAGRTVLLTCVSPTLNALLRAQILDQAVTVVPFAEVRRRGDTVDTVVVDEAQDVMNDEDLAIIGMRVKGGLEQGRWRLFCDTNNQIGVIGRYESSSFDRVRALGVTFNLHDNCRNTRNIVEKTQQLTGADVGVTSAGYGPDVQIVGWTDEQDQLRLVGDHLDRLEAEGVDPAEITMLSPLPLYGSVASKLAVRWRSRLLPLAPGGSVLIEPGKMVFATVGDFKGLENRFVVLVDITDVDSPDAIRTLYTGMTRARAGLWIGVQNVQRAKLDTASRARKADGHG